jgi:hypothetical protein
VSEQTSGAWQIARARPDAGHQRERLLQAGPGRADRRSRARHARTSRSRSCTPLMASAEFARSVVAETPGPRTPSSRSRIGVERTRAAKQPGAEQPVPHRRDRAIRVRRAEGLSRPPSEPSTISRCLSVVGSIRQRVGALGDTRWRARARDQLLARAEIVHESAAAATAAGFRSRPNPSSPPARNWSSSVDGRPVVECPGLEPGSSAGRRRQPAATAAQRQLPQTRRRAIDRRGTITSRGRGPSTRRRKACCPSTPAYSVAVNSPVETSSNRHAQQGPVF